MIYSGQSDNAKELAGAIGKNSVYVTWVLRPTLLSPEIIHLAIIGALPEHVSLAILKVGLPADWEEQKRFLRIE